jgi:hypothetical protein
MLRDVEQDNWKMLHFDPQENVFMPFFNNLNTRIIEKDRFVPQTTVPSISDDTFYKIHPSNRNPLLGGMPTENERGLGDEYGTGGRIQEVGDIRQFSGESALFS